MSNGNGLWTFIKRVTPFVGYKEKIDNLAIKCQYTQLKHASIAIDQEFVHRGRFRGGWAVCWIGAAVLAWCLVFVIGKSIHAAPFQLFCNMVSVQLQSGMDGDVARKLRGTSSRPGADAPAASPYFVGPPLPEDITDQAKAEAPVAKEIATATAAGSSSDAAAAPPGTAASGASKEAKPPKLDSDRVERFIGMFHITSQWGQVLFCMGVSLLTLVYTNMLVLSCLAALVGSMCNYAVQSLKQARNEAAQRVEMERQDSASAGAPAATGAGAGGGAGGGDPGAPVKFVSVKSKTPFGHRRVFSSLTATVVTGVSLGFAAFLLCSVGVLILPRVFGSGGTTDGFDNAVCFASLMAFLFALFPDTFLLVIENRVNTAARLAMENNNQETILNNAQMRQKVAMPEPAAAQPQQPIVEMKIFTSRLDSIEAELKRIGDKIQGGRP
ncbi:MAG: hypothetical protein ACREJO_13365 [Phycisphaerales bacterium]